MGRARWITFSRRPTCSGPPGSPSMPRRRRPPFSLPGRRLRRMREAEESPATDTGSRHKREVVFTEDQQLYRPLSVDEDRERTNTHYEQPVEFFYTLTGGDWNVYSANLWTGSHTQTESQERKL